MLVDGVGHVVELSRVMPDLIEEREELLRLRRVDLLDEVGHGIARLVTEVGSREALDRVVGDSIVNDGKLLHGLVGGIRAEGHLAADPVCALPGNRALCEPVAKPDLELRAIQARL